MAIIIEVMLAQGQAQIRWRNVITFGSSLVSSPERTIHHCIRRQMMISQSYHGRKGSGMIFVKAKEAKITTGNKHDRAGSQPK
ncbi:hypothetical protein ABIE66_001978 [Peribacillus sp. B2I2]